MKRAICITLGLMLSAFQFANAQLTIGCTSGCNTALPNGTEHEYVATDASFASCNKKLDTCKFKWEITNGTIDGGTTGNPCIFENDGSFKVKVKWNNVNANGTVKVTTNISPSCSSCPNTSATISIPIKYLGTPGPIKVNGVAAQGSITVPCGNTPITLSVDPVTNATSYFWTLPAGWSGFSNTNTIVVTPGTNSQGTIKVGVSRSDVPNLYIYGNAVTVNRPLPVLTSSAPGLNGSGLSVCNAGQTINASAIGTNADKFTWTPAGGAKINGSTSPQTVSGNVAVSATTDGGYTVKAYSTACGIASTNSESRSVFYGPAIYKNGYYTTNGLTYGLAEDDSPPYPNAFCWTGNPTQGDAKLEFSKVLSKSWFKLTSNPANFTWAPNQWDGVGLTFKALSNDVLFELGFGNNCGVTTKYFGFRVINCLQALTVYPNPSVQDLITIQLDNLENEEVMPQSVELFSEHSTIPVRTLSPVEIYRNQAFKDGNKMEMNVRELPKGVYYLHVVHGRIVNKNMEKIRLILE
ncbi:hypothetical protein SAMN05216327_103256 [Dyadobacter sp. SG02]|uniref:hypothetical protein n=1 Tax=Dyadobacter sp. SG02 TaxID=1855291 RepID=UPI0008AA96E4|nr:hypothetical protein [Dyadobacter sp. SG02]SEI68827.1 hypothetical protein SAMN05216327_103256 [Dyadobacter sp. SG02]